MSHCLLLPSLLLPLIEKEVKKIEKIADKVMAYDEAMQALSDDELRGKTTEFKQRIAEGETLDDLLPEAFAVCREAAWRSLGMKHFYVQVIGGIVLHQGRISEMKTGEGKTLVATLPAYLNALEGKGVHVVTVNDYLAKRDMEWMGKLYTFLGLKVGCIIHGITEEQRRDAYLADITYGTNNEYGFDYLRDNWSMLFLSHSSDIFSATNIFCSKVKSSVSKITLSFSIVNSRVLIIASSCLSSDVIALCRASL